MVTEFRTRKADGVKFPVSGKIHRQDYSTNDVITTGEYKQVLESEGRKVKSIDEPHTCTSCSTKDDVVTVHPITTDEDNFQSYHCPICGSSELSPVKD